jgi:hypothetical protein
MLRWQLGADHLPAPSVKVLQAIEKRDGARRTTDVRWCEAQYVGCRSIETRNNKVATKKHDRKTDRIEDFSEVGYNRIYSNVAARCLAGLVPTAIVGCRQGHHLAVAATV